MVWKLLSGLAACCLAFAVYVAQQSQNDIKIEQAALKQSEAHLKKARDLSAEGLVRATQKEEQVVSLGKDLEKVKTDTVTAAAEVQEKLAALEVTKASLEEASKQLAALQKLVDEAGDIERLLANVDAKKKEKDVADAMLASETSSLAQAQEQLTALETQLAAARDADARSRKGELEPGFTARVAQAFGEWGFAVVNKGNSAGMIANADLDVKRGNDIVGKLKVRSVEAAISIADVVAGTFAEGSVLQNGDLLVAAPVAKKEVPIPATPSTTTPTTGDPAAPAPAAGDPFAAPAAGMAPAAADPFATPAAPAAPAAADPFATPAAPAAGAGAGTKESPSTADPFK
jgi:hypothetical protein